MLLLWEGFFHPDIIPSIDLPRPKHLDLVIRQQSMRFFDRDSMGCCWESNSVLFDEGDLGRPRRLTENVAPVLTGDERYHSSINYRPHFTESYLER